MYPETLSPYALNHVFIAFAVSQVGISACAVAKWWEPWVKVWSNSAVDQLFA